MLLNKIENAPWYVKVFIGSWVSLYTSLFIWFVLTSWNPAIYEGQTINLIFIYIASLIGYSWLILIWFFFLYIAKLSILKMILSFTFIIVFVFSVLLYPAYNNTKKKIIGANYVFNNTEVIYLFSQEINDLNRKYYKQNIKILYKNEILILFLKELIADYSDSDSNVLLKLLNYNLTQQINVYEGKNLAMLQFSTLNEIMLNRENNDFSNNEVILILDFILDHYVTVCKSKENFTDSDFLALGLPVKYFLKTLNVQNSKLHNQVMNTHLLKCFYI